MVLARDLTRAWRIHNRDGTDITLKLAPYLSSLRIHDAPGRVSDEVTLRLDIGKRLRFPDFSQRLRFFVGESIGTLIDLGDYFVTEYELSGPPDTLEVVTRPLYFGGGADPADAQAPARAGETRHLAYELTTLGAIASTIASRLDLTPAIDPDFGAYAFEFAEQRRETDMAFLGRLAAEAGGFAKVSAGALVVGTMHTSLSYGGNKQMPSVSINPTDCNDYAVEWSARDTPGKLRAHWYDPSISFGGEVTSGDGEPVIDMPRQFASEAQAQRAVHAQFALRARQRRYASFSLSALNLKLWVGSEVRLGARWHPQMQGDWSVIEAMHEITPAGGQTAVAVELKREKDNG